MDKLYRSLSFHRELIAAAMFVAGRVDENGAPYITYHDGNPGLLKIAYRRGSKWFIEVVDTDSAGFTSSVQVSNGSVWITYMAEPGPGVQALKCARARVEESAAPAPSGSAARSLSGK